MKKKPHGIGKPVSRLRLSSFSQRIPPVYLLIAILAAIALAAYFLIPKEAAAPGDAKIQVFIYGTAPFFENSSPLVRVFSSCGNFSIFLDGVKVAGGNSRADAYIKAGAGQHLLLAKNAQCSSSLSFSVLKRECSEGEKRTCNISSCEGVQSCAGGVFSECVLPRKTCVPGEKTGCSLDSCKAGYTICNECGTGFGPCEPAGAEANSSNSSACPKQN
jgi:hypothetical protein